MGNTRKILSVSLFLIFNLSAVANTMLDEAVELDLGSMDFIEVAEEDELPSFREMSSKTFKDPIQGKRYQYKRNGSFFRITPKTLTQSAFDFIVGRDSSVYGRYITFYNVTGRKQQKMTTLPSIKEYCREDGEIAAWDETHSISARLESSIGASGLGLSAQVRASIEAGVSFRTRRSLTAEKGIEAIHSPYITFNNHVGVTVIALYVVNNNNKKVKRGYLTSAQLWDYLRGVSYPYQYKLTHQNLVFEARRNITKRCN